MNFMESAGDLFLLWLFSSWKNLNYKKTWRRKSGGSWSVCWYCSPCFSIPEIISFFKKSGGTHSLFVLFFFVGSYIQTDKEVYTSVVHIHCVCVSDIYVTLRWFTFIVCVWVIYMWHFGGSLSLWTIAMKQWMGTTKEQTLYHQRANPVQCCSTHQKKRNTQSNEWEPPNFATSQFTV